MLIVQAMGMEKETDLKGLIEQKRHALRLSRSALIQNMGYRNISKGLRRLDHYLCTLESPGDDFIAKLCSTLEIEAPTFERAKLTTEKALFAKRQRTFKPYLVVDLSIRPSPWFAAQLIYNKCRIDVQPAIRELPPAMERDKVFEIYRNWLATSFLRDEAIGFRYFRHYGECQVFNSDGELQATLTETAGSSGKRYLGNRYIDLVCLH